MRLALHFSAAYGYGTITRLLLEAGADASAKTLLGKSVLDVANEYRKWEVLEVLETASKSKMSPKEAASAFLQNVETESSGDLSRSAGTSPDEISDFFKAAALGPDLTLKKFIKQGRVNINAKSKGDGRTALHRAANSGSLSRVRLLLDNDAYLNDVDVNGWTALMFAAAHVSIFFKF